MKGLWQFDDPANLGKATVGTNLVIVGTPPSYNSSLKFGTLTLTGIIATAAGTGNHLLAIHNIGANGGNPTRTADYTLVYDVRRANTTQWRSFYQTDLTNSSDAEYFTRGSGGTLNTLGQAVIGYTPFLLQQDAWLRVVIAVQLGSGFTTYIVNSLGTVSTFQHLVPAASDPNYSLDPSQLIFFGDNDSQNNPLWVGQMAVFDGALTSSEVSTLGPPGPTILPLPPVIAEGSPRTLAILKDAPGESLAFNDISGNGPISWSISAGAAHGTAVITSSSATQCSVRYTPAAGYAGIDSYTVRANNGGQPTLSVVNIFVHDPAAPAYPNPVGRWQFDYPTDHTLATLGNDLAAEGSGFTAVAGINGGDGAIQVARGSKYFMTHGIPAGTGGGTLVNEYSLLFDISYSGAEWKTFFQTHPHNDNDGELYIDPLHKLGGTPIGGGSANRTAPNTWYRIVLTTDNGSDRRLYVNGQLWFDGNAGKLDDDYALPAILGLFEDDNGEDGPLNVSNLAIWPITLDATQVAALGAAGFSIDETPRPPLNYPPVITEGGTASANVGMAVATQLTFHVTDGDNDEIQWSINPMPSHGSAQITASSNTECTVTYTSTNNFNGADGFVLSAADEKAAASIAVTLIVQNSAPIIGEGDTIVLNAMLGGGPVTGAVTATDANANALAWRINPAQHGSAEIIASSSGTCGFRYTPASGYIGADSFVVQVSDGHASDSITVNVMISDPSGEPVLAVVSAHGTTTPPPGSHVFPAGSTLNPSAADEIGTDVRHLCTGWAMSGGTPTSGTGNSFSMTLGSPCTLTWLWRSEYRVITAVNGSGSVSVATGWQPAGQPLQITATPAAGHYFAGWSGDTAGCQMGGNNIVLAMTRPYAAITANFAVAEDFTIVALPDTQFYTSLTSPADTFARQTQWVLANREALNIKFLTHVGDLVNVPTDPAQWSRATTAMNLLNQQLAYGTCPGNHDLAAGSNHYLERFGPAPTHESSVGRWTDPATAQTYAWYRGSSPRGYSSYQIVRINGRDFMFLHLDLDCPDQDMGWAASVLTAHPRVLTMITIHNYLAHTGGTGPRGTGTGQRGYASEPSVKLPPDRNKPEEVFNALVKPFNQVYMVICGHVSAIYNLEKTNLAGNVVHEVVCDYQALPNGGNGFLRIMEFRPEQNKIFNSTFSPTLGRYFDPLSSADNQGMQDLHDRYGGEFVLNLDIEGRFNSTLTIASTYSAVSPAAGAHEIADGTPIVVSAQEQISDRTRHRPTGWTLSGVQSDSGIGPTATILQRGDATFTWSWGTEYWLDTGTTGGGSVNIPDGWQNAGAEVSVLAVPNLGASFMQWIGDVEGCVIDGARITVLMNRPRGPITAVFNSATPIYAVNVVSAYPSTNPPPAVYAYAEGSEVTFSAATCTAGDTRCVCVGYQLSGALNESGSGCEVTFTITGDLTLTWNWQTEYRVAADANGPGSVNPTWAWVAAGAPHVLTATPAPGAAFTSWTGDIAVGTATGATFNIASVDRPIGPITANFAGDVHTLTIVSAEDSVTPPVGPLVLPHGTVVDFAALPKVSGRCRKVPIGWSITGDQPSSGTTPSGSFLLNADATLTWFWATEVFLELAAGLEGAVLPMDASGWKPLGATVNLEARPAPRFRFVRWNGDVPADSTSPTLALTMSQPRTVAADVSPLTTTGGTPYWWLDQLAHVSAGDYEAAAMADADGDGQTAGEEFVAGNDDLDPTRRFEVLQTTRVAGPAFLLTWSANTGRNYAISSSPNLETPFTPVSGPLVGISPTMSALIPGLGDRKFFRVEALLPPGGPLDVHSVALSPLPLAGCLLREMRQVPAGWYTRGDNGGVQTSKPAHDTWVAGFEMDRFEVTRSDWETVATWANVHGYDLPVTPPYDLPGNHPAVGLSWYDAVKWCNARSEMEGRMAVYYADPADPAKPAVYRSGQIDFASAQVNWVGNGYRLPTEAEWERASRGGLEGQRYPWGNTDAEIRANNLDYGEFMARSGAFPYTLPVGFFDGTQPGGAPATANAFGLYDMVGNASEWTWDRMHNFSADPQLAPRGPETGVSRVLRGGSWWESVAQATNSQRFAFPPAGEDIYGVSGFRCIRGIHPNLVSQP